MLRPRDLCQSSATKTFLDAMNSGKVHLARFVLDALDGRIINSKTENNCTPLMFAVCLQDHGTRSKFTQLLLEKGADVNSRNDHGRTALSLACELGHLDAIKLLVQFNADPEITDTWGNSALMYAAYGGHSQVLEFLIRAFKRLGLQLDRTNQAGHSAIQVANYFGHSQCVEALNVSGKKAAGSVDLIKEVSGEPEEKLNQPNQLPMHFSKQFNRKSDEPLTLLFQKQLTVRDSSMRRMHFKCQNQSPDGSSSEHSQSQSHLSEGSMTKDGQDAVLTSRHFQNMTLRDMRAATNIDQYKKEDNQKMRNNIPRWGKAKSFNLDIRTGRKQSYQGDVRDVRESVSKFKRASLQDEKPLIAKFSCHGNIGVTNDAEKSARMATSLLDGGNQFSGVREDSVRAPSGENNEINLPVRRNSQTRSSIPKSGRPRKLLFNREEIEPARIKVRPPGFAGLGTRLLRRFTAPEFMRLVRDSPSSSAPGKGKISRSETFPLSHSHQKIYSQPSVDSISGVRCEFETSSACGSLN